MWLPNDGSDVPKIPSGKGKRLIVLHAGTRSEDWRLQFSVSGQILVNPCFIHVHDIIPCFPKIFDLSQIITPIINNKHYFFHKHIQDQWELIVRKRQRRSQLSHLIGYIKRHLKLWVCLTLQCIVLWMVRGLVSQIDPIPLSLRFKGSGCHYNSVQIQEQNR
jgi:hypothetical protein